MVPSRLPFTERWLHYRGRVDYGSAMVVLFGAREAGWFREVAALHSDHYRQAPLYCSILNLILPLRNRTIVV